MYFGEHGKDRTVRRVAILTRRRARRCPASAVLRVLTPPHTGPLTPCRPARRLIRRRLDHQHRAASGDLIGRQSGAALAVLAREQREIVRADAHRLRRFGRHLDAHDDVPGSTLGPARSLPPSACRMSGRAISTVPCKFDIVVAGLVGERLLVGRQNARQADKQQQSERTEWYS